MGLFYMDTFRFGINGVVFNGSSPNPGGRSGFTSWSIGDDFYLFAGNTNNGTFSSYADVWKFNLINGTVKWTWVEGPS
jgi:hypothetical protein